MVHGLSLATITGRWLGETPFVQVSTTWALTRPETVYQRPRMTREIETWLSDSRVSNNSVVDHRSQELSRQMSCLTILGVVMQAVEVDAQRHQHTQANLDGLQWFEAYCQLLLYNVSTSADWSDFIVSSPILSTHLVFGHVARLDDVTPANMVLQLHINVSLNRPPDRTWRRPPGRTRNKWLDQLRNDSTRPTGDLWRRAVDRGHGGATTQQPSLDTRTWWWWW